MFNVSGFLGVPPVMFPVIADGMDFFVIGVIGFTDAFRLLTGGVLHLSPFGFGYAHGLNRLHLVLIAVDDDFFHRASAVGFDGESVEVTHPTMLGVVGAVRATRTTTFFYSNYLPHCATSSLRSMSQMDSPICSISRANISASCCSDTYSPCLI